MEHKGKARVEDDFQVASLNNWTMTLNETGNNRISKLWEKMCFEILVRWPMKTSNRQLDRQ